MNEKHKEFVDGIKDSNPQENAYEKLKKIFNDQRKKASKSVENCYDGYFDLGDDGEDYVDERFDF